MFDLKKTSQRTPLFWSFMAFRLAVGINSHLLFSVSLKPKVDGVLRFRITLAFVTNAVKLLFIFKTFCTFKRITFQNKRVVPVLVDLYTGAYDTGHS